MKSKSKTKNEPWAPAQPYILQGLQNTQQVFNEQQPRLEQLGDVAYDLYNKVASKALNPSSSITAGQNYLSGVLGGDYLNSNPYSGVMNPAMVGGGSNPYAGQMNPTLGSFNSSLSGVADYITNAATRSVGDAFSLAGRTGSPEHAISLGQHVTRELSPFVYGAMESDLSRQFQAGESMLSRGAADYEAERQRQFMAGESMLSRSAAEYEAERQRQMQAASLLPSLRASEFAGVPEAIGLLGSAAEIPWTGVNAYNGNIRTTSNGYGTQTTTNSSGLGGVLGAALTGLDVYKNWNK